MSKRFDLTGKVALVTGASSGLGVHFARTLAAAGASVAIAARRADRLASLQAELQAAGGKAVAVELDVQSSDSITAALAAAENALGPIDIVVNNAGISIVKPALEMPVEDWDAVVNTNLRGAWLVTQTAGKRWLMGKRPGVIVNIASILGLRTIWVPHSYPGCSQHAPDEHLPVAIAREALAAPRAGTRGVNRQVEMFGALILETGMRFAIREGGRTVGAGAITAVH